jgi:Na+/H+-dicarboxylate symporter
MIDPFFRKVLLGVTLGVAAGLFLGDAAWPLQVGSTAFIKLLQVTVLPYMLGSVIVGIGGRSPADAALLARRGGVMLVLVWVVVLLWVFGTSFAYPATGAPGLTGMVLEPAAPIDWIDLYVPANVFHSLASNLLPAVVVFALLAGVAVSGMTPDSKRPLLEVLDAFNEAMRRVSRFIVGLTPIGLFAMAGAAAGTLRVEELIRLQIWLVVYIGSACLIAFWLLPSLVALLTPVPFWRFVGSLQTALVTAFAAGDYFVVLPLIIEANRKLLEEQGASAEEAEGTIGVAVPLLFNFPHVGKILALAFFPFGAWFSGVDFGASQWFTLSTAGVLGLFGNINAVVPFLLDLLRLPADLFNLFSVSSVVNVRFGALTAAMHTAALSMLVAASLLGRFRLRTRELVRVGLAGLVVAVVFVVGTRVFFARILPPVPSGIAALSGFTMRNGEMAVLLPRDEVPPDPGRPDERLARILERKRLRVGVFTDGVPFTFFNPAGELVGFDVEMAHNLATSIGVSVGFVPIERDEVQAGLESGRCDIVMAGLASTVEASATIAFSQPYHEEQIAVLVYDHRRGEFQRVAPLVNGPLVVGAPSERYISGIRRRVGTASVRPYPLQRIIDNGDLGELDAMVLPLDQAMYLARVQPALAAVVPEDLDVRAVVAYAMPKGADALRDVVDTWVGINRVGGSFRSAYDYWVRGLAQAAHAPRWSIGHDLLGLW